MNSVLWLRLRVLRAVLQASHGWLVWQGVRLSKRVSSEDIVLLILSEDGELLQETWRYAPTFGAKKGTRRVLVIADEAMARRERGRITDNGTGVMVDVVALAERQFAALVRLHRTTDLGCRCIVISTDHPFAHGGLMSLPGFGRRDMVEQYLMGW